MSAWIKQVASQVQKHGAKNASWYVEWNEPSGRRKMKSCGPGKDGKDLAKQLAERIKAQLKLGTYEEEKRKGKTWDDFLAEYDKNVLRKLRPVSRKEAKASLTHFARILKLKGKGIGGLTTADIDKFSARRRTERGRKPGSKVSPATINKDLRHIKAAIRCAVDYGYLKTCPKFKMIKEPKKLPTYITAEHFQAMYDACGVAEKPAEMHVPAADWWRGLLTMAYMTGWRISELLALRWEDVDLEAGTALTRASDNKGGRDDVVHLHPVVVDHLRKLRTFHDLVFPWEHHRRTLDVEFARIQDEAGIHLPCRDPREHTCTDACRRYGFHDGRRAFATMNAANMTREALQALMRHASPLTTARYINMAQQLQPAVANLHVPKTLQQPKVSG